jgi:hypothetical protein
MPWSFYVEPGGLVWPDPGRERPGLKEALRDCAESLSPVGTAPELSTYWIDRILAGLSHEATAPVIASGNAWSLVRDRDEVKARFDYAGARLSGAPSSKGLRSMISGIPTRP